MINVAINGFGRIGRLIARLLLKDTTLHSKIRLVAINDLASSENMAYLLGYDTVHGRFPLDLEIQENHWKIKGNKVQILNEPDPSCLPWKHLEIDYVVESTGRFLQKESAAQHLKAGARRVVISAPVKGGKIPTLVFGINHQAFNPTVDAIVSNASCTTNALAPLVQVLLNHCGIEEGLMSTIHAATASQPVVDFPSKKDFRSGRAAFSNIIPASTGAADALGLCIPQVQGKITGMAFRVPVLDVSAIDLTVRVVKETSYQNICEAMQEAASTYLKGVLAYSQTPMVSSDCIGSSYSAIFDVEAGMALNNKFYKLVAWYDNEMGYASRILDLICYMATQT